MSDHKSKYDPSCIPIVENCARMGMTTDEMGEVLGLTGRTLRNYRSRYPEFKAAIDAGKEDADDRVVATLYKAATVGFTSVKKTTKINKKTNEIIEITEETQTTPSVQACMKWLHNRQRQTWGNNDPVFVQDDGDSTVTINVIPVKDTKVIDAP